MWVSELVETAGRLHKELQGGCALGTGHRGVIAGESPFALAQEGCPWLQPAPRARAVGAGVGNTDPS